MKALIQLRRKTMSQAEAAAKMGMSRQQLSNIEADRQGNPSILTVERYARALGVEIQVVERPTKPLR
jgi:transcriptional regulator with XRE-family HTH domain